jgi:hypothetical protein
MTEAGRNRENDASTSSNGAPAQVWTRLKWLRCDSVLGETRRINEQFGSGHRKGTQNSLKCCEKWRCMDCNALQKHDRVWSPALINETLNYRLSVWQGI